MPEYTRYPVPLLNCSNYTLRNQITFRHINARTWRFESNFYPKCSKETINLTPEIRELPTVRSFMNQFSSFIRLTQKLIYGLHDQNGVPILTQLRLGLSKLNSHNFNYSFLDTVDPTCLIMMELNTFCRNAMHMTIKGVIPLVRLMKCFGYIASQTCQSTALVHTILYCDSKFVDTQN